MWHDEQATIQPVQLYQPVGYRKKSLENTQTSFIGGDLVHADPCPVCQGPRPLLLQLVREERRIVRVFTCINGACWNRLFQDGNKFVVVEDLIQCEVEIVEPRVPPSTTPNRSGLPASTWATTEADEATNDWVQQESDTTTTKNTTTASNNADHDMRHLEAQLAQLESSSGDRKPHPKTAATPRKPKPHRPQSDATFPCYELFCSKEPPNLKQRLDADDVGLHDDELKIQSMLARYLEEEEDETILSALRGSTTSTGTGREQDERLSEEERTLLTYTDRIKRCARQVVRYASGGCPLWSLPSNDQAIALPTGPNGERFIFEFQILPTILHVLGVEKESGAIDSLYESMDWGNIAVYVSGTSVACVVQASVDDRPVKMELGSPNDDDDNDEDDGDSDNWTMLG